MNYNNWNNFIDTQSAQEIRIKNMKNDLDEIDSKIYDFWSFEEDSDKAKALDEVRERIRDLDWKLNAAKETNRILKEIVVKDHNRSKRK